MFLVRGAAKVLVGKSLFRRGERLIFGLASGKASKSGYKGVSRFQSLRKRLNVVLSIFIITFREPSGRFRMVLNKLSFSNIKLNSRILIVNDICQHV